MNTELELTPSARLEELVQRVGSLYSLPAIAAKVIELTNNPKIDTRALKECIQTDPALTAKILRVVNSSMFGLSREVSDLNQALALLGTKPLKLLVLGFSLPENLFDDVSREQLHWYWSTTLTRAVAAGEINLSLGGKNGDDAFLAGLLQSVGVLVLLGQLGDTYGDFLTRVIEERTDLASLETELLGFNHLQLSAALLDHWNMPRLLVEAIGASREPQVLAHQETDAAALARVLHLADLLANLIGQHRLNVLPELLEAGRLYGEFDKQWVHEELELLQPRVEQLAEVLSLDLSHGKSYAEVITEAHAQMAELVEPLAEPLSRLAAGADPGYAKVIAETAQLRSAVDKFLGRESVNPVQVTGAESNEVAEGPGSSSEQHGFKFELIETQNFDQKLTMAVGHCRALRKPLSVVIVELAGKSVWDERKRQTLSQIVERACHGIELAEAFCEQLRPCRELVVLPNCERHDAVREAYQLLEAIDRAVSKLREQGTPLECLVSAGIASVALPPKNFSPQDLVTTAERCLAAARSSGNRVVKSLEVY